MARRIPAKRATRVYIKGVKRTAFPLNTVLFPGGPLPLRIFEPRYLDMVSRCMKNDAPFGVLLIGMGERPGRPRRIRAGTLAAVSDWYQGSDGLLGVTATGTERFRLLRTERQQDGLNTGDIEILPALPPTTLPEEFQFLPPVLERIMNDLGRLYENLERRFDDAAWVAHRFVEILPIGLEEKQLWLESDDVPACLRMIKEVLHSD